jgi:small subunit ribosomal protein S16
LLVIRLARAGRAKYPTYRLVAAESSRAATGKFVAVLGHYNPHTKELVIRRDDIEKRLANGAQPSNTVIKLLQRENVKLPDWVKLKTKAPKARDASAESAAPADEPAADPEEPKNAPDEAADPTEAVPAEAAPEAEAAAADAE